MTTQATDEHQVFASLKHMAVCNDCSWHGDWYEDINAARNEGRQHRRKKQHSVGIVTEER